MKSKTRAAIRQTSFAEIYRAGRVARTAAPHTGSKLEDKMKRARVRALGRLGLVAVLPALLLAAAPAGAQKKWTEKTIMERFAHEPNVQQVQQKAIRYYQVHPDRIRSLRLTARLKALMPSISGKFSNGIYHVNRGMVDALYRTLGNKEDESIAGDNLGFSVSASWNLDRLVFNAEVLDVQSLIGILDGVVREVTTIYYIRRRLQIDMILRPPTDLAASISQRIRVEELTGLLDAMTGGFMTKSIRVAKKRARKAAMFNGGGRLLKAGVATSGATGTGATRPVVARPAADRPAADKPAADKPAADKPAATKPAADKPAADKPAAGTPTAPATPPKKGSDLAMRK